ncbi:hypothetical protein ACHHYP_11044 [Achlya hypogyna]|uniref:Uncharacterized protein n=1 Tax=Achlya hypogyna TaxID=1202772 RepID=A0A1V9YK35_ACHHY|nr:hypothetical protein ACHHYP_11044 [Achlya hypogyna]
MAFNFTATNKELPLKLRMNIRDQTASMEASMSAIRASTGIDFAFEVHGDILAFNKAIDGYENRLGDIFFDASSGVLDSLSRCFSAGCADDMIKEAVADACTTKVLAFRVKFEGRPSGGAYHPLSIENGTFFVDFYSDAVWSNVDEVSWTKLDDIPGI